MNVFIVSNGQDTGGQGARIKHAFDRHAPSWNVRAMHRMNTYINYPANLQWDDALARRLFDEADVVHLKIALKFYDQMGGGKPAVVHHQGTELRDNPVEVDAHARSIGAQQLVSTVDLLADCTDGIWLPIPHDLDWIRDKYSYGRTNRPLIIGHAPTNRAVKGTSVILEVLERLKSDFEFTLDLVENLPWNVSLSRKAHHDIFIDQLTLGYGNNGVEAMALAKPVISGWQEPEDRERFVQETGGEPPFVEANDAESLEHALRELLTSADARIECGQRGRAFAEEWHAEARIVDRLIAIYERAVIGAKPKRTKRPEAPPETWTAEAEEATR